MRPGIHKSGDTTSRRDGLTSMVSLLAVLAVKAEERCQSHSEKCRKWFESIEKEKLDTQLEEATRNAEPPPVIAAEMDVEQPPEQPSTGGASSSSVPAQSGREAVPLSSPGTHEVRMETAEPSGSTETLDGGDESSSKRGRSLAEMLLFDEHDTSDWPLSVHETRTSELSDDQQMAG